MPRTRPPRRTRKDAPGMASRRAATRALIAALAGDSWAPSLAGPELEPRDRGFAQQIIMTALKRLGQIDHVLAQFANRTPRDGFAHALLRTGAAQLLFLGTAPHAVVGSAVELAGGDRGVRGFKGMINAVLRRVSERAGELAEAAPASLNAPGWLREGWIKAYGAEMTDQIMAAHLSEAPLDLNVKADAETWAEQLDAELTATGSLRLAKAGPVAELPGFGAGAWWVQDAAAALPAKLLGDVQGLNIADLCAAPGGKTLQLAAGGGRVTAVDASQERLDLLRGNLARTGLAAEIVCADAKSWAPGPAFDAVLLDAPCSATGTLRRHPEIAWARQRSDVDTLARVQAVLLANAFRAVRPGGRLVYAVCSLQPKEGEAMVRAFLKSEAGASLSPVTAEEVGGLDDAVTKEGFLRTLPAFWPERGGMDGFFAARIEKASD